jgi:uncharacterized protein with von Willebrand factor type A (vWA) domain
VKVNDTVQFTANPAWTASGGSIAARYAAVYEVGGDVLAYCLLDTTPADVTVTSGNVLTVKSDNTAANPVLALI